MEPGLDNHVPAKPNPEVQPIKADLERAKDPETTPSSRILKTSVVLDFGDTIYLTEHRRASEGNGSSLITQIESLAKIPSLLPAHTARTAHVTTRSATDERKPKPITLGKTIRAAFEESVGRDGGKKFLPLGSLYRILTKERISNELTSYYPEIQSDELQTLVRDIWDTHTIVQSPESIQTTTRLRIFAILALLGQVKEIRNFIRDKLYDSHLPFILSTNDDGDCQLEHNDENGGQTIEFFSNWPQEHDLESYAEKQWQVLSPYFQLSTSKHSEILHYDFPRETILPFLEKDDDRKRGGFGEVFRVKIRPESHNCCEDPSQNPSYAVKRLRDNDPQAFESEVSNLKRLNKEDNFHLVKLLGTYKYRDQYYLLFPWADGNLLEFWQENQSPCTGVIEHDWVLWFSQQCLGIAQGLEKIHKAQNPDSNSGHDSSDRLHGRHGDLKPENILWFKNSQTETNSISKSVLKISDFGLTRFHRDESKSGIDAGTVGNSPTYRAPEYDVMSTVSQNYDIWALGCVLLEFAAWFLLGWSEIQAFSTNRIAEDNATVPEDNFYVLVVLMGKNGETGARLKASVAKEFNKLWDHDNCSDYMVDFLNFIKNDLLRMDPRNRRACDSIVNQLRDLHNQCVEDKQYSCHRKQAKPERHGTNLSELEASHLDLSPEQIRLRSKLAYSKPIHTGPVEKVLPARDREYARHSVIDDKPADAETNNRLGLFTDVGPDAPVTTLYDQPLSATPTSTTSGPDLHSRPQSPNVSPGKSSHSRSQSVASRKLRFQPGRSTSISEEEHVGPRNIGHRVTHSVETSLLLFSAPTFAKLQQSYPAPTSLDYEGSRPQLVESDPSSSRELVQNEGSLNSTIKGGDDNEIAPANSDVQVYENGQNIQDTQSKDDGITEDTSTQNDEAPIPPPILRFEGSQGKQNGHHNHIANTEEETQPLEDQLELSEVPLSRIERGKKFLRTKLCCG